MSCTSLRRTTPSEALRFSTAFRLVHSPHKGDVEHLMGMESAAQTRRKSGHGNSLLPALTLPTFFKYGTVFPCNTQVEDIKRMNLMWNDDELHTRKVGHT